MTTRVDIPVSGPTKQDRSIQVSPQRSINMYASVKTPGSKSDLVMYSHPGRIRTTIAGIGPIRSNGFRWKGNLYWVSGAELYKQDQYDGVTLVGTLLTSGTRVVITGGRTKLALVDGTYGYHSDGTTLTQITDPDFVSNPTHIKYMDGYFVANDSSTDDWGISASEDPSDWDGLDFAVANVKPDRGIAVETQGRDLLLVGEETTQAYFNSGNADFPFDPYPGAIPWGADAPYSVASSSLGVFMLATNEDGDRAIVRIADRQVQVISDEDLAWQINQFSATTDAVGWVRRQGGLSFYEIVFPAAGRTYSYSIDHQFWSELTRDANNRFRGIGYGSLMNRCFVGDYADGKIFELDFDTHTDDDEIMLRTRRTRVIHNKGFLMSFRRLILEPAAGVGLITGQGDDPMVMMKYSIDGGRTWSSELWRSLGEIGRPETQPVWNNLGAGRDWVFEFSVSDPVVFSMMNLYADVDVGRQ